MKKVIYLMILLMTCFGFYGVVNAADEDGTFEGTENENTETADDAEDLDDEESDYYEEDSDESEENPNTGLNDYVMYLVPVFIVGGSLLLFRKNNFS